MGWEGMKRVKWPAGFALTHLAVSLLQQALLPEATQQTIPSPLQMLRSVGQEAARSVYEEARRSRTDMGTTLASRGR